MKKEFKEIRNADVQGILIENRFHVTYFELKKDKD